jgi:hypothetical protein
MSATVLPRFVAAPALLCLSLAACGARDATSREATGNTRAVPAHEPADGGCFEGCVPDEGASADARPDVCVERALCVRNAHWDPQLCQCVSSRDDAEAGADGCDEHALCFAGYHWDPAPCRCVPDGADGGV